MIHLAPPEADCRVLVYRHGLLSGLGHDLEIAVTAFAIAVDDAARVVEATFDAASLRVVRALRDGREMPDALSPGDRRTIEDAVQRDVLHAARHPTIRFRSTAVRDVEGGYDVTGRLELHGAQRILVVPVRRDGERWLAEVQLHQPDFGIRPYTALLGALAVKPDVTVRTSFSAVRTG